MKAFELQANLNPDHTLTVPDAIAAQSCEQTVRVLVLVDEDRQEELDFLRLGAEQFLKGYDESDAIYDQLPPR